MIRHFCDKCDDLITDRNKCSGGFVWDTRLGHQVDFTGSDFKRHTMKVEVIAAFDDNNEGCYCKYCIIDLLKQLDNRPTVSPNY